MASGEPKAKVIIGADTSEFTKGIKQSKANLKSFGNVSDDILGKLGSLIGVDTKQVEEMASAIRGMGMKMAKAGEEGNTAFNKIASAAKGAGASIAAIGIAAAIASFKALNAEATAFKNTIAGANIELQTQAYMDTYRQVFHDFNSETGKSVAEWEAEWKKGFARFKANATQNFVEGLTGNAGFFGTAFPVLGALFGSNKEQQEAANAAATEAERIAGEIYQIDRQRSNNLVRIAELDRSIAENQRIMRSETSTLAEKNEAYAAATQAVNEKYALQLPLMQRRATLMVEMDKLAENSIAETDATNQAQVEAIKLEGQQQDELRSLERLAKGITKENNAYNKELAEQLRLQKEIEESRKALKALNLSVPGAPTAGATTAGAGLILPEVDSTAFQDQLNLAFGNSLFLEVGLKINKGSFADISKEVESLVTDLAESMSEAVGGLIGDLVTGGDAWGNFTNAAISAMGDMAIAVGKIALTTGVASLGIKAALESLNPGVAIAAGAALIALGAAVKAGLSNVANGNYSAGANVASSAYSYGGGDYETREINVHVTGKLTADGDELNAVINNTNNRNGYTT